MNPNERLDLSDYPDEAETRSLTLEESAELKRCLCDNSKMAQVHITVLENDVAALLDVLKMAYLKHHTEYGGRVDWNELDDKMRDTLFRIMGADQYDKWWTAIHGRRDNVWR